MAMTQPKHYQQYVVFPPSLFLSLDKGCSRGSFVSHRVIFCKQFLNQTRVESE